MGCFVSSVRFFQCSFVFIFVLFSGVRFVSLSFCFGGLVIRIFVSLSDVLFCLFSVFALYVITIIGCYLLLWCVSFRLFQCSFFVCFVFWFSFRFRFFVMALIRIFVSINVLFRLFLDVCIICCYYYWLLFITVGFRFVCSLVPAFVCVLCCVFVFCCSFHFFVVLFWQFTDSKFRFVYLLFLSFDLQDLFGLYEVFI